MENKKLLVLHGTITPYRIDLFNDLNKAFKAHFLFFRKNLLRQKFNQENIKSEIKFEPLYLTKGIELGYKERMIRFGFLSIIRKTKPDIILSWEYNPITVISLLFSKIFHPNIKFVTLCDDNIEMAKNCSGLRKMARTICTKFLDGIVLTNDTTSIWYKQTFPKLGIHVFPILQSEERLRELLKKSKSLAQEYKEVYQLPNRMTFLYVGRMTAVKNLVVLIEAFSQFLDKYHMDASLILVGDGEERASLIDLTHKLNVTKNVILPGRFEKEALYAWYALSDVFVLPSIFEPFGAVVNEALIFGLDVLCSNAAGAASLITPENGLIFNPNDKDAIIRSFYQSMSLSERGQSGFQGKMDRKSKMPFPYKLKVDELKNFLAGGVA